MITTGNAKGRDELGREVLWSSQGQQVMMQWERQYMHQCVDALCIRRSDRVLEIGFGLAYSATHIQSFHPKCHTIIECDTAVIIDAERFASEHSGVKVVKGTWQSMLPTLTEDNKQQFDCVFFDDYPLPELETQGVTYNQTRTLRTRSRWHDFLDAVLPLVAVGGRISGYLARDIDLKRRGCRVEIAQVQVEASENCEYFPHKSALVPVITLVDASAYCADVVDNTSLIPIQASARVLRRVICSDTSSGVSSLDKSRVTSSTRRRFVDIQACLQEQELLDNDDMDEADHYSRRLNAVQQQQHHVEEAMDATASTYSTDEVQSEVHQYASSYSDASSRKRYLAALRQKKEQAKAARSKPGSHYQAAPA